MGYIYKITNNKNNKVYIGLTEKGLDYRWKLHKRAYKRYDYPLYRAMRKYGIENFTISLVEECENTKAREAYWIEEYNTYNGDGYNATAGGDMIVDKEAQKAAVSRPIICTTMNKEFPSVIACARFFHKNKLSPTVRAAEIGINRVLKGYNRGYKKHTFNYK